MKRFILLFVTILLSISMIYSQGVISLWSNSDAPITNDINDKAQLYIYQAQTNNSVKSPAILIFPGGDYEDIRMQNEGHVFGKWLASQGFTAIILKYRLPNSMSEIPFDDAEESIRILTEKADSLNIDLNKLGIAGFSAGGHLATVFSNKLVNKTESIHPLFNILFYPVISFEQVTKGDTRNNLLGLEPSAELIREYSAQLQVSPRTPKTIILLSDNDDSVSPSHSIMYYDALKNNQVEAAMYIFPTGEHGWAMYDSFEYNKLALSLLSQWLQQFK